MCAAAPGPDQRRCSRRHLVDQDDEIVRSQADFLHDEPIQRGEQREALPSATRDERSARGGQALAVLQPTKAGVGRTVPSEERA